MVNFISVTVTVFGIVISALFVIAQMRQRRRLFYVTNLLSDKDVSEGYKAFILDLRFLWNSLQMFPKMKVNKEIVDSLIIDKGQLIFFNHMVQYMRAAIVSKNEYLWMNFQEIGKVSNKYQSPEKVFEESRLKDIERFIHEIVIALSFNPAKMWFLAFFVPAPRLRDRVSELVSDNTNMMNQKLICTVEDNLRLFIQGRWPDETVLDRLLTRIT